MAPYTVSFFASRLSLVAVVSAAMLFSCMGPAYGSLVPALYIFGDSTVDGGNIPLYQSYGIDLNLSSLQPRFSNGLVMSDFIAMMLELPLVPPSKNYALAQNSKAGINYAYGGSGILPETRPNITWSFDIQIGNFSSSIANNLNKTFSQPDQLSYHLSNSIFLISFGINDYSVNYIQPFSAASLIEPVAFGQKLANALSNRLTTLYQMGARKFLVNNIWPMGCMPTYHHSGVCNDTINNNLRPYTELMPQMLQRLASNLSGFYFSYSDDFSFVNELNLNTKTTGITNTTGPCWNGKGDDVCQDRDKYVYFDEIHTTQVVNKLFALKCFNGTLCSPKNIIELVGV